MTERKSPKPPAPNPAPAPSQPLPEQQPVDPFPPADDEHTGIRPRRKIIDARDPPSSSPPEKSFVEEVIDECIRLYLGPRNL